jgi:hypothetical protein
MRFWRNTKYAKIDNWETENSLHKPFDCLEFIIMTKITINNFEI